MGKDLRTEVEQRVDAAWAVFPLIVYTKARQTSEKPDGLLQLSGNNIALQLVNQSFNSALSEDVSVRLDPECVSALHLRLQAAEATGYRTHALLFESEQMRNIVYLTIYRFIQ